MSLTGKPALSNPQGCALGRRRRGERPISSSSQTSLLLQVIGAAIVKIILGQDINDPQVEVMMLCNEFWELIKHLNNSQYMPI
jgi:hypothetical protein